MKSEKNQNEETLYGDNQVTTSNEDNKNEDVNVAQETKKEKSSAWRRVGVGMGLGKLPHLRERGFVRAKRAA